MIAVKGLYCNFGKEKKAIKVRLKDFDKNYFKSKDL